MRYPIYCGLLAAPIALVSGIAWAAEPPCPPPNDPAFGCLTPSGAVVANHDYQVISGLDINVVATGQPGINTNGKSFVKICSVRIHHSNGNNGGYAPGIYVNGGNGVEIHNANIVDNNNVRAQDSNIKCNNSGGLWVEGTKVTGGARGIELQGCNDATLQTIEGHQISGDHEANGSGNFVQWLNSSRGVIQDFYLTNPNVSLDQGGTNGDGVSAYKSTNIKVSNGVVDGLWGWASCAVQDDIGTTNMTVHDVTTFNTTDGAFCVYGSGGKTANYGPNLYAANNRCDSVQGPPSSTVGYMFVGPCKSVRGGCYPPGSKPKTGISMAGSYYGWHDCTNGGSPPYFNLPNRFTLLSAPPVNNHIVANVCKTDWQP